MFHRQRATVIALPAVLLIALSGCSLLTPPAAAPLTGTAACALGHKWSANNDDLATQVLDQLKKSGVAATGVTITGDLTLDWSIAGHVVLGNDYVVTVTAAPAADQVITLVETVKGSATGAAYVNAEVAIPRKWDASAVDVQVVADNNGTALTDMPFAVPAVTFDDSVGIELTCNGTDLTTHPRGNPITQKWTR